MAPKQAKAKAKSKSASRPRSPPPASGRPDHCSECKSQLSPGKPVYGFSLTKTYLCQPCVLAKDASMARPPNHCTFCKTGYFKGVTLGSYTLDCDQCSKQAWWCKWCNLTNAAEASNCELCSAISPQRAAGSRLQQEGWDCSHCATFNSTCSACKGCAAYSAETCDKLEKDLIVDTAELGRLRQRVADVAKCVNVRSSASVDQGNSRKTMDIMEDAVEQETPLQRGGAEHLIAKQDSIGRIGTPRPETDQGNSDVFALMMDVADFLQDAKKKIPDSSYCCPFRLLLQFGNLQKQTEKLCTDLRLKSLVGCQRRSERKNDRFIAGTQAAIIEHLMESGETAESATLIFRDMVVKGLFQDLDDGIIMIRAIDNFRHAMRLRFAKRILAGVPNWGMTQGQKTVLLDSILKTTPTATFLSEDLQEAVYENALISAMSNDPATFSNASNLVVVRRRLVAAFPDWPLSVKQKNVIVDNILNTFDMGPVLALASSPIDQNVWLSALESELQANTTDFRPEDFTAVLKYLFNEKFMRAFPPWPLSDFQKTAVIDRIFMMRPVCDLDGEPDWQMFADALESEARHGALMCRICMEPTVSLAGKELDTADMWFAPPRSTEHWRNQPCGHAYCRPCITTWAKTVVNDQKTSVKCPVDGCSYRLWDQDLKELLDKKALKKHKEHANANHLKHLLRSVEKDKKLSTWLKTHAVPCPDCHVIVSRSQGCDVMTCVCGTKFCYKCGFITCRCKTHKLERPDIWKPQR